MKSVLIIGAGRFGRYLAEKFAELGDEVLALDLEESRLHPLADVVTSVQVGDCTDEEVLRSLGVGNFDVCFVCIGSSFQASLEITSLLKDLGAKHVVAKADRDIHKKFLLRNGADEVLFPEKTLAQRAAVRYSLDHVFDYFDLSPEFGIYEITPPEEWVGKTILEVAVRSRYHVNIIAIREKGTVYSLVTPQHVFTADEHLIIGGSTEAAERLLGER